MIIRNAIEKFYYYFDCNLDLITSDEIKRIVTEEKYHSGFYELCQKYSDIALNAPKEKDDDNGKIYSCLQLSDIDVAVSATCQYISDNNIKDIIGFISSIKAMYKYAERDNDDRVSTTYIPSSDDGFGRFGMYYDFMSLPNELWDKF